MTVLVHVLPASLTLVHRRRITPELGALIGADNGLCALQQPYGFLSSMAWCVRSGGAEQRTVLAVMQGLAELRSTGHHGTVH